MADTNPQPKKKASQNAEKVASQAIGKASEESKDAPRKKIGRPSKYTPEIAQQMCEMLADGIPLREICRQEGIPEKRLPSRFGWTCSKSLSGSYLRGVAGLTPGTTSS